MTILFNSKHSIKTQLGATFVAISLLSIGICLAISLGFTAALAKSSYSTASEGITKQTTNNAAVDSKELAAAIAEDIAIIAESVCMVTSLQATHFIAQVHMVAGSYVVPLKTVDSFREYDFVSGCAYPNCPHDFGELADRSRLSNWNGSLEHSSVYLYTSVRGALRNDSAWNSAVSEYPFIQPVIDALAYQDAPFNTLYTHGYNTSVFFYLSVAVGDASSVGGYISIHRGYPGTERNSTSYDPPNRSWFKHAPIDDYYLDGPYKETFTNKYVLNLSSRKRIPPKAGAYLSLPQPSVVVASSVMLLDSLAEIIRHNTYPNEGFGVLVKFDTLEVVVWKNASTDLYNEDAARFYTLSELDPALGAHNVRQQGQFSYIDATGEKWLVAATPCLDHTDHVTGVTEPALVMLVFSQWAAATSTLPELHSNIDHTTNQVYQTTGVITGAVLVVMLLLVFLLVSWLTAPLDKMHVILAQIVARAAEDEAHRDYSDIVHASWFDLHRSDELGFLATSFWYMVVQLHNATQAKKNRPKYPTNPFHVPTSDLLRHTSLPAATAAAAASAAVDPISSDIPVPEETKQDLLVQQVICPDEHQLIDVATYLLALETRHSDLTRQVVLESVGERALAPEESAPVPLSVAMDGDILSQIRRSKPTAAVVPVVAASEVDRMELGAAPRIATTSEGYAPVASAVSPSTTALTVDDPTLQEATAVNLPEKRASRFFTLRVYLFALAVLLIVGLLAVMAATIYLLQQEGDGWTVQTADLMETSEVLNLHTIATAKAAFATAYFKQQSIDTRVLARAFTTLLDGSLTDNYVPFYRDSLFLQSYSLDPSNYYAYPLPVADASVESVSGYFDQDAAQCRTSSTCATYQDSNLTRVTSMLDLQMASYMHAMSILSFIQTGHEDAAYTRLLPYTYKAYGDPTSCYIEDRTRPECDTRFLTSACNPAVVTGAYPAYDARCRSWYQLVAGPSAATQNVFFEYPRVASTGDVVITTATPVRQNGNDAGDLEGVLSLNVLAATLSDSVNQLKILDHGYVYVFDAANTTNIVLHPRLTPTCTSFRCCEHQFTDEEFAEFESEVLTPLQTEALDGTFSNITSTAYRKGGKEWRFALAPVRYGSVNYVLLTTVPRSDVLKSSTEVTNQIEVSNTGIIIAASVTLFVFICVIVWATCLLVRSITGPVHDLTDLCENIMEGNLHSSNIPKEATSSDMAQLLEAFTNMLTALRFGSDSYARGDIGVARALFEEALVLYTTSHNDKGVGACHNNLGAVHMSVGEYDEAQRHYQLAIAMAEAAVAKAMTAARVPEAAPATPSPNVIAAADAAISKDSINTARRCTRAPTSEPHASLPSPQEALCGAQKTLSDRRGNLALLYIAQERYPEAFKLLESCMEDDRLHGYIRGCVVKQGNMGHLYMKQGEMKSAERIFHSSLSFVYAEDGKLLFNDSNAQEVVLARQIALFNMARLHERALRFALAEHYYMLSLSQGEVVHLGTTTQTLALVGAYLAAQTPDRVRLGTRLDALAKTHRMTAQVSDGVTSVSHRNSGPKRVAFALDYSGSMSGSKIRAAVESLDALFTKQLHAHDELQILIFSSACTVELPFTKKIGNETRISEKIRSLQQPGGGTALYDGIWKSVEAVQDTAGGAGAGGNGWVVVLTDGQEGSSRRKRFELEMMLRNASCGFVMIGVGADVDQDELEGLVQCVKKGFYVGASGDQKGIEKAFGQVAVLIQGQVILEEL